MLDQINWLVAYWLLMLVGGEIVDLAFAKSIGLACPVPFSFGFLRYLLGGVGIDYSGYSSLASGKILLLNAKSGFARECRSRVLNQIFAEWVGQTPPKNVLNVEVFNLAEPSKDSRNSKGYLAWLITIIQIVLTVGSALNGSDPHAAVVIVLVTIFRLYQNFGNVQRRSGVQSLNGKRKTVVLTPGNGSRYAMVIVGNGVGLDLEQLATAYPPRQLSTAIINQLTSGMLIGYLMMFQPDHSLITSAILGSLYNIWLAYRPSTYGIEMYKVYTIEAKSNKVLATLRELEETVRHAGVSLVPVFFPGELREDEQEWVDTRKASNARAEADMKVAGMGTSRRKA